MRTFTEYLLEKSECTIYTTAQLKDLEKFADGLLSKWGIDIEFSKHFGDRMGDSRNDPCIKISELQQLFKKVDKDKAKKIKAHSKDGEAVLVDLQKSLNLPFVIDVEKDEFVITLKTIMRKTDFKTPDEKVVYENKGE
jgi:hypothetical protein